MRASDATNQIMIGKARQWYEYRELLVSLMDGLEDDLKAIEERRQLLPADRQKSYRQAERWAIQQQLYIRKLDLRNADQYLHRAVCDLERRLCESNAQVWKIVKGE